MKRHLQSYYIENIINACYVVLEVFLKLKLCGVIFEECMLLGSK